MQTKANPWIITVDIETTDTEVTSKVAAIGAVAGNVLTGEVVDSFYCAIEFQGIHQPNRTSSQSTLDFWEKQKTLSPEAYKEMFDPDVKRLSLDEALKSLNGFYTLINTKAGKYDVGMFGNGPEFDNAILAHAMGELNITPAWRHGANQSVRTAVYLQRLLMGEDSKRSGRAKIPHHALSDAEHEFEYMHEIISSFIK